MANITGLESSCDWSHDAVGSLPTRVGASWQCRGMRSGPGYRMGEPPVHGRLVRAVGTERSWATWVGQRAQGRDCLGASGVQGGIRRGGVRPGGRGAPCGWRRRTVGGAAVSLPTAVACDRAGEDQGPGEQVERDEGAPNLVPTVS